jgi:hypothetical protein
LLRLWLQLWLLGLQWRKTQLLLLLTPPLLLLLLQSTLTRSMLASITTTLRSLLLLLRHLQLSKLFAGLKIEAAALGIPTRRFFLFWDGG